VDEEQKEEEEEGDVDIEDGGEVNEAAAAKGKLSCTVQLRS